MSGPQIDGILGAEEWREAGTVAGFRENLGGEEPRAATQARVGFDDENLYASFECAEPLMSKTTRRQYGGHDKSLWNNECVEVFLDPRGDRASFVHFIVDILNQRFDALGADTYGYNPGWRSATAEQVDGWSAEMALPFSALGVQTPADGDAWVANLCRERKAHDELSAWRPTYGSFAMPGRFGTMVFGSLSAYLRRQGETLALDDREEWPGVMTTEVAEWQARTEQWRSAATSLDEAGLRAGFGQLMASLTKLQADARKLTLRAGALSGKSFVVARAWPYEVFDGAPATLEPPPIETPKLLLHDEWLDLCWNVTNLTDKPMTLRATLRNGAAEGHTHLNLGLPGFESNWRLATPVAAGDGRPVYDALAPIPAGSFTVIPGGTSQVWLSLKPQPQVGSATGHVRIEPIDGTAGDPYVAPLALKAVAASVRLARAVHCFTWNLVMPPVTDNAGWYRAHLQDLADHGVDVCMIHSLRLLPRPKARADGALVGELDFSRVDRLLDVAADLFDLYYMTVDIFEKGHVRRDLFGLAWGSPAYEKAFKAWLRQVVAHLLERGITREQLMINPYDESVNEDCRTLARWIKEVDPQLQVIIDCSTRDLEVARQMAALTDVWAPHYKYHLAKDHKEFFAFIHDTGKPHWCYFYSEGGNDKAQHPTRHYLAKFWWAFSRDITGVCYWAQQYYGDPWYRAEFRKSYDTSLVYPMQDGVAASRRWEAWRRGWQDSALLLLARREMQNAGDQPGLDELIRRLGETVRLPGDPMKAHETRQWLRRRLPAGQGDP